MKSSHILGKEGNAVDENYNHTITLWILQTQWFLRLTVTS